MKKIYPRITSIDALRAFALFGILLVHVRHGFNADVLGTMNTTFDSILGNAILALLHGKCALIFEILFGISFYLILRKPNYPSSKFVWRCILLFLLGCINRFFMILMP